MKQPQTVVGPNAENASKNLLTNLFIRRPDVHNRLRFGKLNCNMAGKDAG